jgi:hypothetical protein
MLREIGLEELRDGKLGRGGRGYIRPNAVFDASDAAGGGQWMKQSGRRVLLAYGIDLDGERYAVLLLESPGKNVRALCLVKVASPQWDEATLGDIERYVGLTSDGLRALIETNAPKEAASTKRNEAFRGVSAVRSGKEPALAAQ